MMYLSYFYRLIGEMIVIGGVIRKYGGIHRAVWYFISFGTRDSMRFLFYFYATVYARLLGKPLVHAIGDSHVKAFKGKKRFVVYHIGAPTAHNLVKKNSLSDSNRRLFRIVDTINHKDIVLLSFGEIDCRIHIYNQHKKSNGDKPLSELIDNTVANYGQVLQALRTMGVNFVLYGVPPATRVRNENRYEFYATPEVHAQINGMFNGRLKSHCQEHGYTYIDVHSKFSDGSGYMLEEYALDEIHLSSKVVDFVKGEIREQLGVSI